MATDERFQALWETIKQRIKAAELNQPLYRALDAAVPITLDGADLVLGFDVPHEPDMHFINAPAHQPLIQKVLSSVATKPLNLVTIDGTTMADYQHYLARQRAASSAGERSEPRHDAEPQSGDQDNLDWVFGAVNGAQLVQQFSRAIHQRFRGIEHRTLLDLKAQFLERMIPQLAILEETLADVEPDPVQRVRQFSRAVGLLAEQVDAPEMLVAVEYRRYKQAQR